MTADTGNPMPQATVMLTSLAATADPRNDVKPSGRIVFVRRNVTTDAQGNFAFTELPAGSYRIDARPGPRHGAYSGIAFGATKPSDNGSGPATPIQLADGQSFDTALLALPRAGAITGRVVDEHGEPISGLRVFAARSNGRIVIRRTSSPSRTDDLGHFRIYGLSPGDYVVGAAVDVPGRTIPVPGVDTESEEDEAEFLPTYFPSTADEGRAQRVHVREAAETAGAEIRMVPGRLYTIGGIVTDSQGRPLARAIGSLNRQSTSALSSAFGLTTDAQGRFQIRRVAPGTYHLVVHQQIEHVVNGGVSSGGPGEFASVPLTVAADLDDMVIVTGPGATITGQIVFDRGVPPSGRAGQPVLLRVEATPGDPWIGARMPSQQPATVGSDQTFTLSGVRGEAIVRPVGGAHAVKSVTVGGVDITDTPHEFTSGDRVTMVLASRPSMLEGRVTDARGGPAAGSRVILFSEHKGSWRMDSLRTRHTSVDRTGRYRVGMLTAGRYYIAAVPAGLDRLAPDAAFFEELAKEATAFFIGDDERRVVDLQLAGGGDD